MYQPAYSATKGAPQHGFAVPHQHGFPQTGHGQTGAINMPNGQNANLPRSVSMMSGSSAIISAAEEIRQRYKRTKPKNIADGEKDYKCIVQSLTTDKLSAILKTKVTRDGQCDKDSAGLKETQAREFRKVFGKNLLTPPVKRNKWLRLLEAIFTGIFNILLWSCIVAQVLLLISDVANGLTADFVTPILLGAVVVMAGVLQWHAEMSAENQMEALQKMQNDAKVNVVRRKDDGSRLDIELDPIDLVPGDVCFLSSGCKVPADVRIIYCTDGSEVDNSALTGESLPEPRKSAVEGDTCSSLDARNLAFFGTSILKGNLTCIVVATGDETYLGKIAQSIKSSRSISTLEVQIIHFVHIIAGVAIIVGVASLIANLNSPTKRSISEIVQNSFAALFAQVPEGLLPTVTISLMIASQEMFKRDVLVRKIDAVETLGCVTVFCSDKTGTLTKGEMTVQDFVIPQKSSSSIAMDGLKVITRAGSEFEPDESLNEIVRCGILNNAAEVKVESGEPVWSGSPTEKAILRACSEIQGSVNDMKSMRLKPENNTLFEIPFNSENKWMLTVHGVQGQQATVVLKGAPDRVLTFCSVNSDEAGKAKIEKAMNDLMQQARRVLCIAKGTVQSQATWQGTNERDCNFQIRNLDFVGLFGIEDPPKEGVDMCVTRAQKAGVTVVMVTGDHPATARAIARRINILDDAEGNEFTVITGADLEDKVPHGDNFDSEEDPEELGEWWEKATTHARVFARVSPIHKQVIVQAYQTFGCQGQGEICAMTGDGVNDAPALKQANVGVAMGERGTDVAKDAADIVLIDDEVASVIAGMEQGRLSSENLQKSIMYTLCSKLPQVAPTFAELFGAPSALTVAQVLLIDIGTDIWTAIAYACQPAESRLMERPPRHPRLEKLVNWKVLVYSYLYMGVMVTICCWVMYFHTPGIWELFQSGRHPCIPPETGASCHIAGDAETVNRGRSVYYWTLVMGQIAAAISTTTKFQSVFGYFGTPYCFPNTALNLMFVGEVALGLLTIYTPLMQNLFDATYLDAQTLLLPLLCLVVICWIEEVRKLISRMCDSEQAQDTGSDSDFTDTSTAITHGDESSCSDSDAVKPLLC